MFFSFPPTLDPFDHRSERNFLWWNERTMIWNKYLFFSLFPFTILHVFSFYLSRELLWINCVQRYIVGVIFYGSNKISSISVSTNVFELKKKLYSYVFYVDSNIFFIPFYAMFVHIYFCKDRAFSRVRVMSTEFNIFLFLHNIFILDRFSCLYFDSCYVFIVSQFILIHFWFHFNASRRKQLFFVSFLVREGNYARKTNNKYKFFVCLPKNVCVHMVRGAEDSSFIVFLWHFLFIMYTLHSVFLPFGSFLLSFFFCKKKADLENPQIPEVAAWTCIIFLYLLLCQ